MRLKPLKPLKMKDQGISKFVIVYKAMIKNDFRKDASSQNKCLSVESLFTSVHWRRVSWLRTVSEFIRYSINIALSSRIFAPSSTTQRVNNTRYGINVSFYEWFDWKSRQCNASRVDMSWNAKINWNDITKFKIKCFGAANGIVDIERMAIEQMDIWIPHRKRISG